MEAWKLELMHSGSPGMKWYVRRFQNYDGSLTPEGRKRYGVGDPRQAKKGEEKPKRKSFKERIAEKKKAKQRAETLERARQAKAAKAAEAKRQAELAADKERVLRSGTAAEVMKYQGQLTNQELSAALNRIQWERQLSSFSAEEKKSNWDKMDDFIDKVSKTQRYISAGAKFWNTAATVANSFLDEENRLPVLDGGISRDKRKGN